MSFSRSLRILFAISTAFVFSTVISTLGCRVGFRVILEASLKGSVVWYVLVIGDDKVAGRCRRRLVVRRRGVLGTVVLNPCLALGVSLELVALVAREDFCAELLVEAALDAMEELGRLGDRSATP